jgi:hypothetical protein
MTPREKAERAKQLLEDPVFRHVLEDIRMGLVGQLEASPIGDVDTHHEVALTLQLLARIKPTLQKYANEIEMDKHKRRQESFIEKTRQRLFP